MQRLKFKEKIQSFFKVFPVVALVGPRQVGKTTLAREWTLEKGNGGLFLDLQNPLDLARLNSPSLNITPELKFLVVDEIQLKPELFSYLRSFIDANKRKIPILLLGSASRDLIKQGSESLAGRIAFLEIPPFSIQETENNQVRQLRGGYPLSYLADNDADAFMWLREYIRTFLERDIPQLGFNIPPAAMRRIWEMIAHVHGNILNFSELGRSMAISDHTVRRYIDILTGTFVVRTVQPWHENISKRQVRAPKIYIRDTGLLHSLLRIESSEMLSGHPKLGASWEGYAMEGLIHFFDWPSENIFYWATHSGAELDLLVFSNGKRIGFEFKMTDNPKSTKSIQVAIETLKLDELIIVIPGVQISFELSGKLKVRSLDVLMQA